MNPEETEINRLIEKLDQVAVGYEAKWGVYRLESLAEPPLSEKWDKQIEKINLAIQSRDVNSLRGLIEGAEKGYKLLEDNALAKGEKPSEGQFWEVRHGSKIYRIVKTMNDARSQQKPENQGVTILTIEEVVRIYETRHEAAFGERAKVSLNDDKGFNWSKGDEIPFE